MTRVVPGVLAGLVAWVVFWFGGERVLSALMPDAYGVHQRAFEAALIHDGPFTANTTMLVIHIGLGAVASMLAGWLSARVAGDARRAPLALGVVLLAFGVLKAVMSWPYVPIWYHGVFTAMLLPLTCVGGARMRR